MANDLTGEFCWSVDTVGVILTARVRSRFRWVSKGASAGDDIIVKDGAGKVIWVSVATGANYVEESQVPVEATGLTLDTIDSGTLYVYFVPYSRNL